jgi:hypothetical protein
MQERDGSQEWPAITSLGFIFLPIAFSLKILEFASYETGKHPSR